MPSRLSAAIAILGAVISTASAQDSHDHSGMAGMSMPPASTAPSDRASEARGAIEESMSGSLIAAPHMTMTPHLHASAADSTRAQGILDTLRGSIEKYRDVNVALAEGYKPFLPKVPQKVYHFTSTARAIAAAFHFDPAKPSSLLYKKTATGYELVGAMYTAPKRASLDELNARVPLGIAQWHLHTNICLPPASQKERWLERRDGKPVFGPIGSVTTATDCEAEGGRFFATLFGWMVHVNPYETDPAMVWGTHEHGEHEMEMH